MHMCYTLRIIFTFVKTLRIKTVRGLNIQRPKHKFFFPSKKKNFFPSIRWYFSFLEPQRPLQQTISRACARDNMTWTVEVVTSSFGHANFDLSSFSFSHFKYVCVYAVLVLIPYSPIESPVRTRATRLPHLIQKLGLMGLGASTGLDSDLDPINILGLD